jgi:hypothetical protein
LILKAARSDAQQHRLESELNAAQSKMVTDVGQSRCALPRGVLFAAAAAWLCVTSCDLQGWHEKRARTAHQSCQTAGQGNGGNFTDRSALVFILLLVRLSFHLFIEPAARSPSSDSHQALKAEINMLRHKGGHIYTPVSRH